MKTVQESKNKRLRSKIASWRCSARLFSIIGGDHRFSGTLGLRHITGRRDEWR